MCSMGIKVLFLQVLTRPYISDENYYISKKNQLSDTDQDIFIIVYRTFTITFISTKGANILLTLTMKANSLDSRVNVHYRHN